MKRAGPVRRSVSSESGVFVPGLMGAGILLSFAMLVTDGIRRLFPVRGDRARAARVRAAALGRANDLAAVERGEAPLAARVPHVPRSRRASVVLGLAAAGAAGLLLLTTQTYFNEDLSSLAGREEWGFGAGWMASLLVASGALVWLASGVLGERRPPWLDRLAAVPPLGQLPSPDDTRRFGVVFHGGGGAAPPPDCPEPWLRLASQRDPEDL